MKRMRCGAPLLVVMVIFLMLTSSVAAAATAPDEGSLSLPDAYVCSPPLPGKTRDELEAALIVAINQLRAQRGLCQLTFNSLLRDAARTHSESMSTANYFSHTGCDGSTPGQRVQAAGYIWSAVGESVAAGQSSATEIMAQWMASPTHAAVLLRSDVREIGIGYVYDPYDQPNVNLGGTLAGPFCFYWTVDLGARSVSYPRTNRYLPYIP